MPSAERTWPENTTLGWKKWHFLGLIFRWKFLSLLNTISICSNIASTLGAKIQMSLRYSKRVVNCWSPKHCSIRWLRLDSALDNPRGTQVNSYSPHDPTLNVFFLISSSTMASCKYPWVTSKEVNQLLWWTACNASSVHGRGNASLMVIELSFLLSTHRHTSPVFLHTFTTWDA